MTCSTGPGKCERHGCSDIPFCQKCHDEWAAAHPRTVAEIAKIAAGRGSIAALHRARVKDEQP